MREEEARRDAWWAAGHRDTDNWPEGWPEGADREAFVRQRAEMETEPKPEPPAESTPLVRAFRRMIEHD